jgi:DHA1 family multidrug resistance protein-like MFS transporter
MAFLPMLPIYVRERFGIAEEHEAARWAGLIYGIAPLTAALLGPLWGSIGDRHGRKAMALRAILGITVVAALMPFATTPLALLLLRALQGALAGYVAPAMSLVSASAPADRQGRVIARLQIALALGLLAGPALGSEIAVQFGRPAVFWATSLLSAFALVPLVLFAREDRSALRAAGSGRIGMGRDLRELFATRSVLALLVILFLMRFGLQMADAFVALFVDALGPLDWVAAQATSRAHAVDRTTALVFVIHALAQVFLASWWGRFGDRFGPLRGLALIALGLGLATLGAGFAGSIRGFVGCRIVAAVFTAGATSLSYAALSKRIAPQGRSVAFASLQSCMQFGMFAGPLTGGLLAEWTGLRGTLFLAGAAILGSAIAMHLVRRREAAS